MASRKSGREHSQPCPRWEAQNTQNSGVQVGTAKLGIHGMYRWDIGSASLRVISVQFPTPPTALSLQQIGACLPVEIELVSHYQARFGGHGHIQWHEQSCYILCSSSEVLP